MSPPWLGRDWHLAGNLDDVTLFTVYARFNVWFGSRWVPGHQQEQTKEFCFESFLALMLFLAVQNSSVDDLVTH